MHANERMTGQTATAYLVDGTTQTFRVPVSVTIRPEVILFTLHECKKIRRVVIPLSRIAHISINEVADNGYY